MPPILIKYINPKHIDDFINGNIHLTPLKNFRKPNVKNSSEKINDETEGYLINKYSIKDNNLSLTIDGLDLSEYLVDNRYGFSIEKKFTSEDSGKWGIFSCTALDPLNNDLITKIGSPIFKFDASNNIFFKYEIMKIRKAVLETLYKEVGNSNRVPVIIFPNILNTLKYKQIQENEPVLFNKVHYYSDHDKTNFDPKEPFAKQQMNVIFEKQSKYKNQREFRIAMLKDCTKEENQSFNIGNIKNNTVVYNTPIPSIKFIIEKTINPEAIKSEVMNRSFFLNNYCLSKKDDHTLILFSN